MKQILATFIAIILAAGFLFIIDTIVTANRDYNNLDHLIKDNQPVNHPPSEDLLKAQADYNKLREAAGLTPIQY